MNYLTWRELRAKLNEVNDEKVLDEPALFAHLDNYGEETLVPMRLIQDTWHPNDEPSCVFYNEGAETFERLSDLDDEEIIPIRRFPHGALLLSYREMDEDLDETKVWLSRKP